MIYFEVLDNTRWQANIEEKQVCYRLDLYWPFAFQHGSMIYNTYNHNWIPNATDNPWAKTPENENHVIHTLGLSLQLTYITLTIDVA